MKNGNDGGWVGASCICNAVCDEDEDEDSNSIDDDKTDRACVASVPTCGLADKERDANDGDTMEDGTDV